jgi:hypothetical protein
MADTVTTNYNLVKPEVGASSNTWGGKLNDNMDDLDALIKALNDGLAAAVAAYTAADVLAKLKTVDGAGSGLDADLLDGQSGTFYQNASNQNAGTLPDARLSANVALKGVNNNFSVAQTIAGAITAIQNFISSTINVVIATTGAGAVFLRPNGAASAVGQLILDAAGNVNVAGDLTVTGGNVNGTASGNPPNARQIVAGNGLTGGGALAADCTLNVGQGTGITVAADTVGVDATVWRDGNPPTAAQIGTLYGQDAFGSVGTVAMLTVNSGANPGPGGNVAGSACSFSSVGVNKSGTPTGTWQLTGNIAATGGSSGSTTTAKRVA